MKKNNGMTVKFISMGLIILLLLIGNMMIHSKLDERRETSHEACSSISKAAGGSLKLRGIYFVVPYEYTVYTKDKYHNTFSPGDSGTLMICPKKLNVDSNLQAEERTLGIYSYPVFTGKVSLAADFNLGDLKREKGIKYHAEDAYFLIKMDDSNIQSHPKFIINEIKCETEHDGSGIKSRYEYEKGKVHFETQLDVRGAACFESLANADETVMKVKCNWASPGFTGYDYLPVSRNITEDGFTATWSVPFGAVDSNHFMGFQFVDSVNVYRKLDRAINYGFLFIIVPFIALFLFEAFANFQLHPVQYLLSGAASVVFFLLLLALSEHIDFNASYFVSGSASGILVSLYVASISRKIRIGLSMTGVFIALYAYLFYSLSSEDYAFLIGSIFAFMIIVVLMFFTRKSNLVRIEKKKKTEDEKFENSPC